MANKAKQKTPFILPDDKNEMKYENKEMLERFTRKAVNHVFKKKGGIGVPIQNLIHLIVTRYKMDVLELVEYMEITLKEMPDISNKNLCIILLLKVASNSKNRKMGRIANEMLKENWWAKNSEKTMGDIYNRMIEIFKKQKRKDLLKEILFTILEMIIELYRRPTDDRN